MILRLLDDLNGWSSLKRALVAFALGLVAAFCQAPFDAFPVLWISFPFVVLLLDSALNGQFLVRKTRLYRAFSIGWAFGLGYFLNGFWWASLSFFVEGGITAWMAPIAIVLATSIFAVFWGVATAIAGLFWQTGWNRVLLFAAAMSIAEFLRSSILPGFPWNSPGYAFLEFWVAAQSAAAIGLFGLNFLSFLIFSAPAALVSNKKIGAPAGWLLNIFSVFCLVSAIAFGFYRLNSADAGQFTDVQLRILQPNVPQREKWEPENRERIMQKLVDIGSSDSNLDISLHIWPESVFPYLITEKLEIPPDILKVLSNEAYLIAGAIRREIQGNNRLYYNSLLVIDSNGSVEDVYDKVNLMPFGEYIPLLSVLDRLGLEELARTFGGLSAGTARRTLEIPDIPAASPLICYEIIFPNAVAAENGPAQWLVNVTNDAWFGDSPGPYQHLAQSRLRAIEEGIPVIRSANTGISGIIDANGRVLKKLEINKEGFIDGYLPAPHSTARFEASRKYAHFVMVFLALLVFGIGNARSLRFAN